MRVHLYTQCWNDEFMLPFFFRHYDSFVDRYFIYDDGSSDRSLEILTAHPKVEIRRFERTVPDSFEMSTQVLSNTCWKESRGAADWAIVTDMDEHLHHRSMPNYLAACTAAGVTLVPALGFQMIGEEPEGDRLLFDTCVLGAPWSQMMKPSIFDPNRIGEMNFVIGRHSADPVGDVRVPLYDEVLLLHYKYIGFERTYARHRELYTGLRVTDIKNRWGHRYSWAEAEFLQDWNAFRQRAVDVRRATASLYPIKRWWHEYPTVAVTADNGEARSPPIGAEAASIADVTSGAAKAAAASELSGHPDPLSRSAYLAALAELDSANASALAVIDADIDAAAQGSHSPRPAHPHDLPPEDVAVAMHCVERPDLLRELMRISRETFGFYTCHFPFAIKHAWAAGQLERVPAGSAALDVGTGLSPLPLFLARRGVTVDCVDNSELIRALPPADDWNEWGFFDYGRMHQNLAAHNVDILDFQPRGGFDAICSTGALAHMTAADRASALRRFAGWLKPECPLVLTLALLPGTEFLWNLSSEEEFEPRPRHGTIDMLLEELSALNFRVTDFRIVRKPHKSVSDFLMIACTK